MVEKTDSLGERHTVFWSWQNDYSPNTCRYLVQKALQKAIEQLGNELEFLAVERGSKVELDHDTKNEPGMRDIVEAIIEKIRKCAIFVADLTPIGKSQTTGKALPNPNVLIELGWALHRPGANRIIGILNLAAGFSPDHLPFDLRGRRILTYSLAENAKKGDREIAVSTLAGQLREAIRSNLESHLAEHTAQKVIEGVPAKDDDPSIWSTAKEILSHQHALTGAEHEVVNFPACPRSYMRIIPAEWPDEPPMVAQIRDLPDKLRVEGPTDNSGYGNYGATDEGYVRYWLTGDKTTENAIMYFSVTGEFWMVHGTAVEALEQQKIVVFNKVVRQWSTTLRQSVVALSHLGASSTLKVEAGLYGVKDTKLYFDNGFQAPIARKNSLKIERQTGNWTNSEQIKFLYSATKKLFDLFGDPCWDEDRFVSYLLQLDPARQETKPFT